MKCAYNCIGYQNVPHFFPDDQRKSIVSALISVQKKIHIIVIQISSTRPSNSNTRPSNSHTRPSNSYTRPSNSHTRVSPRSTRHSNWNTPCKNLRRPWRNLRTHCYNFMTGWKNWNMRCKIINAHCWKQRERNSLFSTIRENPLHPSYPCSKKKPQIKISVQRDIYCKLHFWIKIKAGSKTYSIVYANFLPQTAKEIFALNRDLNIFLIKKF